jgi:hypothetical protein
VKHLVEFALGGGTVVVETVAPEPVHPAPPAAPTDGAVEQAPQKFEAAFEALKPVASAIVSKLRGLSDPPHEMTVELALKATPEGGLIVAAGDSEANYKVTLTWKR